VLELHKDYDLAKLKMEATGYMMNVSHLQKALLEAQGELAEKDKEIARLKDAFQIRRATVRVGNRLHNQDEGGQPVGLPYCYNWEEQG
jgi:hypothetical protein